MEASWATYEAEKKELEELVDLAIIHDDMESMFFLYNLIMEHEENFQQWTVTCLNTCVPNYSMGPGTWRSPNYFGTSSNYANLIGSPGNKTIRLSGGEFTAKFRFDRAHIARLVEELQIPEWVSS
jgi:hypothetical protein